MFTLKLPKVDANVFKARKLHEQNEKEISYAILTLRQLERHIQNEDNLALLNGTIATLNAIQTRNNVLGTIITYVCTAVQVLTGNL